jgi:hypothetical protein
MIAVLRYNLSTIPCFNDIASGINTENSNILKVNKTTKYSVIKYDKKCLTSNLFSTYGLCRSIILNSQNKVVSFAPPKSIQSDVFIQNYPKKTNEIIAEEFVEGTMVNVFWDSTIGLTGGWEFATKNIPGAETSFFKSGKNKTFREMFLEAINESNLNLNILNPLYCYSFVLQHPENRIVVPFKKPQLYLVAIYYIEYFITNIFIHELDHRSLKMIFELNNTHIKMPEIYEFNNYSELIEKYASMNTSYSILGVVIYNKETGERTKIRNPVYEQVHGLRGNQPKLQYQYLSLRKEGRVKDYLNYYPENKKMFSEFRDHLHLFTNTLLSNYKICYIKKEKPLKDFSDQYKTHMFNIHQIYINDLRPNGEFITNTIVQKYVNNMQTPLLMYCLNHHMRKRKIDTIIADSNLS